MKKAPQTGTGLGAFLIFFDLLRDLSQGEGFRERVQRLLNSV
jgi:hypothetical protein